MTPEEQQQIEEKARQVSQRLASIFPALLIAGFILGALIFLNIDFQKLARHVAAIVGIGVGSYYLPFLIKRGWEAGKNSVTPHAKVCDMCFRDIKAFNAKIAETQEVKLHKAPVDEHENN